MSKILHLHNNYKEKGMLPGLMIGRFGIQYIDLDKDNKLNKFDEITFANGDDEEEVREGLKRIVKKNKIKKVNLVVPEFDISTFYTTIYIEKNQKEREVILDYLQKNTQMDPKDIVFDYDILEHKEGVLIASVIVMSKARYQWYTRILKDFKVYVSRVISENTALSKSLVKEDNNEPHVIVNVLPQYITLSIVGDNVVYKTEILDSNINKLNKRVNSFILEWYSNIGRVVHERTHHVVVNSYDETLTKEIVSKIRNTLSHINVRKGFAWTNCFSVDEYIPKLHKKDLYRYSQAIGGSLIGRK